MSNSLCVSSGQPLGAQLFLSLQEDRADDQRELGAPAVHTGDCCLVGNFPISLAFSPQVIFTSLDLVLHTEALLSAVNFLSAALSSRDISLPEKETRTKTEQKTVSSKPGQCNMHTLTQTPQTHCRVFNVDNVHPDSCTAATWRL